MGKMTINDLWSTTQKTKDLVTRTLLKPVMRLCASEESVVITPLATPVVVLLVQTRWYVMIEEKTEAMKQ
jgi:hypothetical protein